MEEDVFEDSYIEDEIKYKDEPVKAPPLEKEIQAKDWVKGFTYYKTRLEESISKFGSLLIKDYVFLQKKDKWTNDDLNKVVLKFQAETNGTLPIWKKTEGSNFTGEDAEIIGYFSNLRKCENFEGEGPSVIGDIHLFKDVGGPFFSACYLSDYYDRSGAELKGASNMDDVLTPIYRDSVITHLLIKTKNLEEALKGKKGCDKEDPVCLRRN